MSAAWWNWSQQFWQEPVNGNSSILGIWRQDKVENRPPMRVIVSLPLPCFNNQESTWTIGTSFKPHESNIVQVFNTCMLDFHGKKQCYSSWIWPCSSEKPDYSWALITMGRHVWWHITGNQYHRHVGVMGLIATTSPKPGKRKFGSFDWRGPRRSPLVYIIVFRWSLFILRINGGLEQSGKVLQSKIVWSL